MQLEQNHEIVVLIPYYETSDVVRRTLTENGGNIDLQKYEKKEGSLIIIDSVKAYFGLDNNMDLDKFIQNQVTEFIITVRVRYVESYGLLRRKRKRHKEKKRLRVIWFFCFT